MPLQLLLLHGTASHAPQLSLPRFIATILEFLEPAEHARVGFAVSGSARCRSTWVRACRIAELRLRARIVLAARLRLRVRQVALRSEQRNIARQRLLARFGAQGASASAQAQILPTVVRVWVPDEAASAALERQAAWLVPMYTASAPGAAAFAVFHLAGGSSPRVLCAYQVGEQRRVETCLELFYHNGTEPVLLRRWRYGLSHTDIVPIPRNDKLAASPWAALRWDKTSASGDLSMQTGILPPLPGLNALADVWSLLHVGVAVHYEHVLRAAVRSAPPRPLPLWTTSNAHVMRLSLLGVDGEPAADLAPGFFMLRGVSVHKRRARAARPPAPHPVGHNNLAYLGVLDSPFVAATDSDDPNEMQSHFMSVTYQSSSGGEDTSCVRPGRFLFVAGEVWRADRVRAQQEAHQRPVLHFIARCRAARESVVSGRLTALHGVYTDALGEEHIVTCEGAVRFRLRRRGAPFVDSFELDIPMLVRRAESAMPGRALPQPSFEEVCCSSDVLTVNS